MELAIGIILGCCALGAGIAKTFDEVYNMRFKLFRGKAYISNSDETTNILIKDEELAKLIEKYCNEKKAKLQAELDEL